MSIVKNDTTNKYYLVTLTKQTKKNELFEFCILKKVPNLKRE